MTYIECYSVTEDVNEVRFELKKSKAFNLILLPFCVFFIIVGLFTFNAAGLAIGLIAISIPLLGLYVFNQYEVNHKRYNPHLFKFDQVKGILEIIQNSENSTSVKISYKDLNGFSYVKRINKNSKRTTVLYVVELNFKDFGRMDIMAISREEKAQETVSRLNSMIHWSNTAQDTPQPVLSPLLNYKNRNGIESIRWQNSFAKNVIYFIVITLLVGLLCVGLLSLDFQEAENLPLKWFVFIFVLFFVGLTIHAWVKFIRRVSPVYTVKIKGDMLEYVREGQDGRIRSKEQLSFQDIVRVNVRFIQNKWEENFPFIEKKVKEARKGKESEKPIDPEFDGLANNFVRLNTMDLETVERIQLVIWLNKTLDSIRN